MKKIKHMILVFLLTSLVLGCIPVFALLPDTSYTMIAGGRDHSLALKSDGTLWAWGSNENGQLGFGQNVKEVTNPTQLPVSFVPTAISADIMNSAAIDKNGNVYIWGPKKDKSVYWKPVKIDGLKNIVAIDVGEIRLLALDKQGTVYEYTIGEKVRKINISLPVVRISAGGDAFIALDKLGNVYTWGNNNYGQLGNGSTKNGNAPTIVKGLTKIIDVAMGWTHALAVNEKGEVWAWGSNAYGEVGIDPNKGNKFSTPQKINNLSGISNVSAGYCSSMALVSGKNAYAWGYGEYGQLGIQATAPKDKPQQVKLNLNMVQIASGIYHNMALTSSGKVYAWGRNDRYQIGNNSKENALTPVSVLKTDVTLSKHKNIMTGTASSWAVNELDSLYYLNVLGLYPWQNYQSKMTRGEFAAILVDVYEAKHKSGTISVKKDKFTDISNSPYQDQIRKAVQLGIVNGRSDSIFDPFGNLTRQEAAKMISIFNAKMKNQSLSFIKGDISKYVDSNSVASWAVPYVYYTTKNNIMKGDSNHKFNPNNNLSKEEGLIMVSRLV